jgi:hypothetical protein
VLFFVFIFVVIFIFTNFNLFAANFLALFAEEAKSIAPITSTVASQNNDIASIVDVAEQYDIEIQ